MKNTLLQIIPLALLLTSCAASTERYTDSALAPVPLNHVQVVTLSAAPHPYTVIGEVKGDALLNDTNFLRTEAAKLGADAISVPVKDSMGYITAQAIKYN